MQAPNHFSVERWCTENLLLPQRPRFEPPIFEMVDKAVADQNEVVDETAKFNKMIDQRITETLEMSFQDLKLKIDLIDELKAKVDDYKRAEARYHFAKPHFYYLKTMQP
jgi:hypothetical protein